jgi:hypothetical protein
MTRTGGKRLLKRPMPLNRDESFVPLTPAALPQNERADYRVTVMAQAANVQPFRPLGQAGAVHSSMLGSNHEPRVTVQHEGDRVSSIQIQCTCGQIIELACVYEPAPAAKPAPVPPPEPAMVAPLVATPAATPAPPPVAAPQPVVAPLVAPAPAPAPALASAPAPAPVSEIPAAKAVAKKPKAKGR